MRHLFFIFFILIPLFAVLCGCTASFPSVLLPERFDGTPYSSVKCSDKTKEKKKNTEEDTASNIGKNTETAETPVYPVNPAYKTPVLPQITQQTAYNPYQNFLNPQSIPNLQYPQVAGITAENRDTGNNNEKNSIEKVESVINIQKGDTKQLRHLLADIIETPQEEWKITEKELSERLTALRQTIKNEKNTELESLYVKQLRNAVLPVELPAELPAELQDKLSTDADTKIAAKDSLIKNTPENYVSAKEITPAEISAKKTAPKPKYAQLAQINEPVNQTAVKDNPANNIVPASYQNTAQPLPLPDTVNNNYPQNNNYSQEYSSSRWEQQIRIGADMLKREIEQTPSGRTFENEIKLRLLESALGNRNEAVRPFTTEEKRFTDAWSNMMLGISTLYDFAALPDRKKRIESAAFRFDECSAAMNQFCPLRLRNVQLVNGWLGFGAFEPKEDVCISGEEVGIYLELENPVIKRSAKGYNVSTAITYEIRDMTANIIEKSDKIYAEDTAPSLRHDHCIHFKVFLPETLAQGQYQLRINVTDMNSDKMQYAEEQIPLRVRKGTPAEQAR